MDKKKLAENLSNIVGKENVIIDKEKLICYSYDATAGMKKSLPDVFVTPTSTEQVQKVIQFADEHEIPVFTRGAGTNLSGGTIPDSENAIVMGLVKMDKILEIDPSNLTATVQPGVIIEDLNNEVEKHGLMYPPDPGSVTTATMGGSTAECSGGLRGLKYGVTKHYTMGMEIVLANGKIMRCGGKTVKNVSAYDMVKLFTGSEGTLGIITEITVKLMPTPEARKTLSATFKKLDDAADTVFDIISSKVIPATLEIMDNVTIKTVENYANIGLDIKSDAMLIIEVDGISEVVEKEAKAVEEVCKKNNGVVTVAKNDEERDGLLQARRDALPALAQVSPTTILEDATVPRSEVPKMIKALQEISKKYNLKIGTFGHAGDGNLHPTILTDERNTEEMEKVNKAIDEIFENAIKLGGTLSGEHGIGIAKKKYVVNEFGEDGVEALKAVKKALDPKNILNPGKIVSI